MPVPPRAHRRVTSAIVLLALVALSGSVLSQSAQAGRVSDHGSVARGAQAKVFMKLVSNRVGAGERAQVRVALGARHARTPSGERLGNRPVKVVVKRNGTYVGGVRAVLSSGKATVALPRLRKGVYQVRAVYLGASSVGKVRSRYRTLTVLGPGADLPETAGFPDESNTGVPAGTALTPYTGPSTITKADTVIDGKTMGCIAVEAPGVVIRNSRISCRPSSVVVASFDGDYSGTRLLLEDVEIDCQDGPGTAVGEARVTVRRADISGCENGFDVNQAITVEDSYIHDLWNGSGAHTDGIQLAWGHLEDGQLVDGARNVVIRHNTIFSVGPDGSLGTSAIISNPSGDRDILIEGNLLAGGAYTLYCDADPAENYQVVGNHFSRRFSSNVGAYGPSDRCGDDEQSGNVIHETLKALKLH